MAQDARVHRALRCLNVPGYSRVNLGEVEDQAPKFGLAPHLQSRFARKALGLERSGITHYRIEPNFRIPFGHTHGEQEEIYVVLRGSGRLKLDDDVIELRELDAVRIGPSTWRNLEGGPDGLEVLAFGAAEDNSDVEMKQAWWTD
jgi:mannose-6-phosphate isomerase-like protein (cupin superfamily)